MSQIKSYIPGANQSWIKNYASELQNAYMHDGNDYKSAYYNDPDGTSFPFYEALATFLNKRERDYSAKLKEVYRYQAISVNHFPLIAVSDIDNTFLFYLKSDQLGFSAPFASRNHPYDTYIELAEREHHDMKHICEQVAEWVYGARSLGGSFLWPLEESDDSQNPEYNMKRGGTKNSAGYIKYYIEDRADLTLLEIKHAYADINKQKHNDYRNDILYSIIHNNGSNTEKWLTHFQTFQTYAEFFCFDEIFVSENGMPFDLISEQKQAMLPDNIRSVYDSNHERGIYIKKISVQTPIDTSRYQTIPFSDTHCIMTLSLSSFEHMLTKLNSFITARSVKMEDCIHS